MKKLIIDRFEGNYAVCEKEDKSFEMIPKLKLPPDCREGECIIIDLNGIYQKDIQTTQKRELQIRNKMKRLLKP